MKKKFVIAITRRCGSGGTTIGRMLADKYNIALYDRELLKIASLDSGINEQLFMDADERIRNSLLYRVSKKVYQGELIPPESSDFTSSSNLFNYQAKVLHELAKEESYVVIGRAADFVLKDRPNIFSVFLHAPEDVCIQHEMDKLCSTKKEAAKYIKKMDKYRSEYYEYYTGQTWENPRNFHLCLDTSRLGYEKTVGLIYHYMNLYIGNEGRI